ncbi:MAG: DUF1573 domain-containing protein [Bacteroidales bacterium]|nr:DUF1573 domain-containing protein [Bacteroidales bacterium]
MKTMKYFFSTLFILFIATASAQSIKFDKKVHNYGTIKEEAGKVECKFTFSNEGDKDLVIKRVNPSCGCTTSDYTKGNIAPGEQGFISAIYKTKGRPGSFNKAITVYTNDPKNPNTILFIKGKVTPREKTKADHYPRKIGNLRMKTNHMAFMDVLKDEIVTDTIGIYNQWDEPMTLSFGNVPDHINIKAKPGTLQPDAEGLLIFTYDASKKNDYGLVFERFYLMTNDKKQPRKVLNVSARLKEDFSNLSEDEIKNAPVAKYNKIKHNFGKVKPGSKQTYNFILRNEGQNDLKIRKVKASCGCTATHTGKKTLKSSEETNIKVTFNTSGRSGKQHKTITVITNDPKNPRKILHIQANIQ